MMEAVIELIEWTKDFFLENGAFGLFILSFAEASFFPVPPDIVLIPLAIISPKRALYYSAVAALSSTLGGIFGYLIGVRAGRPLLSKFAKGKRFKEIETMFSRYGGWAVAIAGFTPIPYKAFTIASGVFRMKITTFVTAAFLSRSARFFLEGAIIVAMGESAQIYINKLLGPGSFILIFVVAAAYYVMKKNKITFDFSRFKMNNCLKGFLKQFGEFGIYLIAGFILVNIFGILFFKLGTQLSARWLYMLDNKILAAVNSFCSPAAAHVKKNIDVLFGPYLILALLAIGLAASWRLGKRKLYIFMTFISFIGGFLIQWGLKLLFHRPRISPAADELQFFAYGFPSGAMLVATAVVGYIAFLMFRTKAVGGKIAVIAAGFLTVLLIGISRIYAGISFPTDVIAGFLMGIIWLTVCVLATKAYEYYKN